MSALPLPVVPSGPLVLLREEASGDAAADLDRSLVLLREVARGQRQAALRIYAPASTLAFGRRDTRLPGFEAAQDVAREHGFTPVVRSAGGRATAYHSGTLVIDHLQPDPEPMLYHQRRFARFGELYAAALRRLGVDAGVGELAGEYCPGEFSVHGRSQVPDDAAGRDDAAGSGRSRVLDGAAGPVKLVGTAQRVVAGAWLFSSVVMVADTEPLRAVTTDVYAALGLPLDPGTVGTVEDLVARGPGDPEPEPGRRTGLLDAVAQAVLRTWAEAGHPVIGTD